MFALPVRTGVAAQKQGRDNKANAERLIEPEVSPQMTRMFRNKRERGFKSGRSVSKVMQTLGDNVVDCLREQFLAVFRTGIGMFVNK